MIPKAERDRIISKYLEDSKPKERECWACGTTYVGLRIICGAESCGHAWQAHCRDVERRHPQSRPSGAIF